MLTLIRVCGLVACLAWACSDDRPFGALCTNDRQCASRICVSVQADADEGRCTRSCATDDECPRGTSCRGATNQGVVICLPGPSVPLPGM